MTDTVKIAVCDDEKNIRAYLVSLIKKQDITDGEVSAEASMPSHSCLWERKRSLQRYSMDTEM